MSYPSKNGSNSEEQSMTVDGSTARSGHERYIWHKDPHPEESEESEEEKPKEKDSENATEEEKKAKKKRKKYKSNGTLCGNCKKFWLDVWSFLNIVPKWLWAVRVLFMLCVLFFVASLCYWRFASAPNKPMIQTILQPSLERFQVGQTTRMDEFWETPEADLEFNDDNGNPQPIPTILSSFKTCNELAKPMLDPAKDATALDIALFVLICGCLENPHLASVYGGISMLQTNFKANGEVKSLHSMLHGLRDEKIYENEALDLWYAGYPGFLRIFYGILKELPDHGKTVSMAIKEHREKFGNMLPSQNIHWRYLEFLSQHPFTETFKERRNFFNRMMKAYSGNKSFGWQFFVDLIGNYPNEKYFNFYNVQWTNRLKADFDYRTVPFGIPEENKADQKFPPWINDSKTSDFYQSDPLPFFGNQSIVGHSYPFATPELGDGLAKLSLQDPEYWEMIRDLCAEQTDDEKLLDCGIDKLVDSVRRCNCKEHEKDHKDKSTCEITSKGVTWDFEPSSNFCEGMIMVSHKEEVVLITTTLGNCAGAWKMGHMTQQMMNSLSHLYRGNDVNYFCNTDDDSSDKYEPARSLPFLMRQNNQTQWLGFVSGQKILEVAYRLPFVNNQTWFNQSLERNAEMHYHFTMNRTKLRFRSLLQNLVYLTQNKQVVQP